MAGIIAVYALVIAVLLASSTEAPPTGSTSLFAYGHRSRVGEATANVCRGFMRLGAGLSVGLTGTAAGYAIGIIGDQVGSSQEQGRNWSDSKIGCSRLYATITSLRWNGADVDFCRSFGSLRVS